MKFDDSGVFVVGCQRSGTTLLRMMLDSHPQLCSPDESGMLLDLQRLITSRWSHLKTFGLTINQVLEKIREFFLSFHHNYCLATGKPQWVDKTPSYVKILPFIEMLFPSCKIIHIIRDGRDVAASFRQKWGLRGFFRCLHEWPECMRKGQAAGSQMRKTQYLEIRYESLVEDPRQTMQRVIRFLGLEWDEAVLAHHSRPHVTTRHPGWERPLKPLDQRSVGSWQSRLRWQERALVSLAFHSLLQDLGYIEPRRRESRVSRKIETGCALFGFLASRALRVGEKVARGKYVLS